MTDRSRGLRRGDLLWVAPDPTVGSEQHGRRPALVVASDDYLRRIGRLVIVVPVTTRDRGWPNHVRLRGDEVGLGQPSFAMTEQVRTIDRSRVESHVGHADQDTLLDIDTWLRDHLGLR